MWRFAAAAFMLSATLVLVSAGCGGGTIAPVSAATPLPSAVAAQIDAVVQPYVGNKVTAGIAVGVGYRGQVLFTRGYGLRDYKQGLPMLADTPIGIGSVTKHITDAALLRLTETVPGFSVDDPLGKYIPEYIYASQMTIRQVMYNVAGIPGAAHDDGGALGGFIEPITQAQIIAKLNTNALLGPPGTVYDYANAGYFLLGVVIERVSHQSYTDYIANTFMKPLGMAGSGFLSQPPPGMTVGYVHNDTGAPYLICPELNPSWANAPGGIVAPVADMLRWDGALRNGQAIAPASFAQMLVTNPAAPQGSGGGIGLGLFVLPNRFGASGSLIGPQASDNYFNDGYDVVVLSNTNTLQPPAYVRDNVVIQIHNIVNPSAPATPGPIPSAVATVPEFPFACAPGS